MDNSLYVILSKQKMMFGQMDIIANNIANVNTTGFKADYTLFKEYLVDEGNKTNRLSFVHDEQTVTDMKDGPLVATERPFDVAITGDGFFTVETPLGPRYTRAGNFRLNTDNELVTAQGYPVLDADNQRIAFAIEDTDIRFAEDGRILVNGEDRGALGVVTFANPRLLEKTGTGLYKTDTPSIPANEFRVAQGMVEGSNVTPITELTHMIEVTRSVATTSNLISSLDDLQRNALRVIAKQS